MSYNCNCCFDCYIFYIIFFLMRARKTLSSLFVLQTTSRCDQSCALISSLLLAYQLISHQQIIISILLAKLILCMLFRQKCFSERTFLWLSTSWNVSIIITYMSLNPTMQCSRGIILTFLRLDLLLNIQFVKKFVQWVVEINISFWEKSLVCEALEGKGLQR